MKKRFTEEQIIRAIKEHEAGGNLGISPVTFYNWRSKHAGLEVNEAKRLKEWETENTKLKKLLAEKLLEVDAMKICCRKSGKARQTQRSSQSLDSAPPTQ